MFGTFCSGDAECVSDRIKKRVLTRACRVDMVMSEGGCEPRVRVTSGVGVEQDYGLFKRAGRLSTNLPGLSAFFYYKPQPERTARGGTDRPGPSSCHD
jgi:hypothetical protein